MYEQFFGLTERPFAAAPRVERFFPATAIEEARQNLTRCIERAEGPALIIGASGTGKSTLCQALAEQFHDRFEVGSLCSARLCTRRALLQAILYSMGLPYREMEEGELRLSLIDHLDPVAQTNEGLLLLVDEAHALPLRLLEELRMITNLVRDGRPRVRLVLAGAPALEERFASPKLDSFNQRISTRCYLQAFDSGETAQYVRAQMATSGANDEVFDSEALAAVYRATGGIPRLINQVCDHALVLAAAGNAAAIGAAGIEEAWADLQQLPLPPAQNSTTHDSSAIEFGSLDGESSLAEEDSELRRPQSAAANLEDHHTEELTPEPEQRLDEIESHVSELEEEFQPAGTIGPEVELIFHQAHNPFDEPFDEEEVVIDQYASLDADILQRRTLVENRGRDQLDDLIPVASLRPRVMDLQSSEQESAPRRPDAVNAGDDPVFPEQDEVQGDDPSLAEDNEPPLILVEDEPVRHPPARARRQEYGQLFARLRQG